MKCEQAGVTPLVPKPLTNNAATTGRFDKRDFHYDAKRDRYICPAGEHAIWRFTSIQNGMAIRKYWSSACPNGSIRSDCTTSDYRRLMRWEHEAVIERMQRRLDRMPQAGTPATPDRRAHVRHAQIVDGRNALPDEAITRRANGDELAGPGVQPEASDADHGRSTADRGDAGVTRRLCFVVGSAISRLMPAFSHGLGRFETLRSSEADVPLWWPQ